MGTKNIGGVQYPLVILGDKDTGVPYNASGGGGGGGDASAANQATQITLLGTKTTSVTALETGGVGIIGWLSQVWRDLVVMSGKLPATLGVKPSTAAVSVVIASDDAQLGAKTTASTLSAGGSGMLGWLSDAVTQLKAMVLQLPSAIGPQTAANSLSVVGRGYLSDITVTRPANTTAYTAGDVVGGAITFTTAGPSSDHVLLTWADLAYNVASIPSGMTSFRLHLYDATPPSALADNAVWDLGSGDRANYLGYIDLGSPADLGSTLYTQQPGLSVQLKLVGGTSLYGYLVTIGGYTPAANSETFKVRLRGMGV